MVDAPPQDDHLSYEASEPAEEMAEEEELQWDAYLEAQYLEWVGFLSLYFCFVIYVANLI